MKGSKDLSVVVSEC